MADLRRIRNVVYYEYTPATIDYHVDLDAFAIARADIGATERPYRLALVVVVTERDLAAERLGLGDAIVRARPLLDRLVTEHRGMADQLTVDLVWIFNIAGQRTR
jgi:hypothetical protein